MMTVKDSLDRAGETLGYYLRYIIGFLIIFAIGLVALWGTRESYH